jgi:O-antigen/teichoic acid export membrane protein
MISKIKNSLYQDGGIRSIRHVSFFSGGGVLAQLIMMAYAIIVARALGPESLGIYSGLYAILGITITFVNYGLDQWTLKEAHNYESVKLISGKIFGIKLALGACWGLLCLVLLPITRPTVFDIVLVLLAVTDVLSDVLFNTIVTAWTIQRDIKHINTMLLSSRGGKLILLILLIFLDVVSPTSIVASRLIISLFVLLLSLLILKPVIIIKNTSELLSIIKSSTEFGLSEILAMIYANIDVAILTYFSISDTGLYSPASGIIHALFIIPNSLFIYLLPHYAKKFQQKAIFSVRAFSKTILMLFFLIGLILSVGVFISGEFVVTFLLDSRYLPTINVIRILSPIMLFKSLAFGLALIIVITGNQRKRLLPQFIVSIFNILFNIMLIPYFGLMGVAWIYTISEFILMAGYLRIAIRVIKNEENQSD